MPKEIVEEKFSQLLWEFNKTIVVIPELEMQLRIAFQEGLIKATEFFIENFDKRCNKS